MNPYASPQTASLHPRTKPAKVIAALVVVCISLIAVFYSASKLIYQESLATPDALTEPMGIHDPHGKALWLPDEVAKVTP